VRFQSKGSGNRLVTMPFDDFCVIDGRCITLLHNHILDIGETCEIAIKVPDSDRDIMWSYDLNLPFPATAQYSTGAVWTGGTALDFNNKQLGNPYRLGISGVYDPTVSDEGDIYDSTRYGAVTGTGATRTIAGQSFGSGWFRLERNKTFLQKITSHYDDNNIVTRFSFIEI